MKTGQRVVVAGALVLAGSVAPLPVAAAAAASSISGSRADEITEVWAAADRSAPPQASAVRRRLDEGTSRARLESRIVELRARQVTAMGRWDLQRVKVLEVQLAALVRRMECASSRSPVHDCSAFDPTRRSGADGPRPWWTVTAVRTAITRI